MTETKYNRITTLCVLIAVLAMLLYEHVGKYGWICLLIAAVVALFSTVTYFRYHWSRDYNGLS